MKQLAVVNYGPERGSVEIREVPVPAIGPEDVLLEVAAVGVCGSDIHQWLGDQSWKVNYPVVLGHEFAGTVRETGERVTGWKTGDRVASETAAVIDPDSPMTRQGLYNLDPGRRGFGYGVDGAMTKFARVPARCLHRLPDALPFEKAALAEPCCVAYSAAVVGVRINPGDRVVVLGPGTIGILCGLMAKLCGATVAFHGLEQDAPRLEIARRCGGLAFTDGIKEWAFEADGLGADGVIDASGVSASLKTALEIVRPNGWIAKVGWGPQPMGYSLDPLVQKNVRLQGSFSHNWGTWERVLRLLASGQFDVGPVIGGVWLLEKWRDAFEAMHSGKTLKAIITP
jgi:alcohol dehydrogenase/L-iditol 2-dehydrogenase